MPIYKTEKKKDGLQQYKVVYCWTDSTGARRQKSKLVYGIQAAKETEARLALVSEEQDSAITISNLVIERDESRKSTIRESTLQKSSTIIRLHILPYLGSKKLTSLTAPILQKWKNEIDKKGLSVSMKNNIYRELVALLNYAVRLDYIKSNPLTKVGNFKDPYFAAPEEKIRYYTPEEFTKFIAVAKENTDTLLGQGIFVFFCISYLLGTRKGETNALKWSDIDGDTIKIRRSISQKLGNGDRETPPKNKSSMRDIKIPSSLLPVLEEHKQRQQAAAENWNKDFRICGGISTLRDSTLAKANVDYAAAAGLRSITIHEFRHSHASLLISEGINIKEIARRLGHSKVDTTWQTYAHLYPKEEERALNVLNNVKIP